MIRQLKFRAWDTHKKVMINPIGFDLDNLIAGRYLKTLDGCIVMQFTGMKDRDGQEIYEGDIVESAKELEATQHGIFLVEYKRYRFSPFNKIFPEYVKVIGNIYENPEVMIPKEYTDDTDK